MASDEHGEPRRSRDQRSRGERPGAVRLRIASRLPWLGGYPVASGVGAVTLVDPVTDTRHSVDRAGLATATRAVKQLVRDHRPALAEVVGDVDRWHAAVMAVLDGLKPTIHDGAALPDPWSLQPAALPRRAARARATTPALAPLIDALGWIHGDLGASPTAALTWTERRADALARVLALPELPPTTKARPGPAALTPLALALALRHLADEDGDRLVDPLITALADPAIHTVTPRIGGYLRALGEQITRDLRAVPTRPPSAPLGPLLRELVPWLLTVTPAARRLCLRALTAARLPALVAAWHVAWALVEPIAARLTRPRPPSWDELVALRGEVNAASRAVPGDVELPELGRVLRAPTPALLDLLDDLPELEAVARPAVHAPTLLALHAVADTAGEQAALAALIAACLAPDRARRWPLLWDHVLEHGLLRRTLHLPMDAATGAVVGAALGVLLDNGEAEAWNVEELVLIASRGHDVAVTVALMSAWRARPRLDAAQVGFGLQLVDDADQLREIAPALDGLDEGAIAALAVAVTALGATGRRLARDLVQAGEVARLRTAGAAVGLARALQLAVAPLPPQGPGPLPPALARYPAALHPALTALAAAGGAAQAAGILDDTFPDPAATARELAAIEARLADGAGDARLRRRADNLRARRAAPPPVSDTRIERLRAKLTRAADVATFERWLADVRAAIDVRLARAFELGLDSRPSWLDAPTYQRVFAGIVGLPAGPRALARRVLARRAGPPPWDLRDEPHNAAWLTRLTARGVDVRPWLDGIGVRRAGRPVRCLALEDDPLEVLRMGEHFSTCLAPTSFNFFAAVVNAAEINKRVLYARDPAGAVIGRCLIGLTDAGGLVTFQPYCHDRTDLAGMVRDFVAELAAAMGTMVVPTGRITPLAGCGWYDDGPRDLTSAFAFLADGAPFLTALTTIAPDDLLAELTARFAPLPVGGMALALVVALPELDARPELIVPCLPLLDGADDVPRATRLRAARRAERAGRGDLLGDRFVAHLRPTTAGWHADLDLLELLAPRAPARLLAWLRAARSDLTEHDRPYWDYGHGLALAALHRPAQAGAALRAAARSRHRDIGARARARLRTLALDHPRIESLR